VAEAPQKVEYYEKRKTAVPTTFKESNTDPALGVTLQEHLPSNTDINGSYSSSTTVRGIQGEDLSIEFSQELLRKDPIWKEKTIASKALWLERAAAAAIDREFQYQVKAAYYTVVEARLGLDNAFERYKQDRLYAQESEKKYQAGIIAEYMVLDYRRDYEQSQSRLVVRRSALEHARNQLFYLLQMPFDSEVVFKDLPEPGLDPQLCDSRRMIDARMRSELRIAQLRFSLFSNDENLRYLKNSLLPSVRLRAGADWFNSHDNSGAVADFESRELSAGVLFTFPLFRDKFTKRSNIALEKIDQETNEITLTDRFRELVVNVRDDLTTVNDLRERHKIAQRIQDISARDYKLAKLCFEVGNVGSWDMIRSKNEYFGSLDDLISLRHSLLRRLAALERDYPYQPTEASLER
jgi:outer membrane protein TolC